MQLTPGSISRGVIIHSHPSQPIGVLLGASTGCYHGVVPTQLGVCSEVPKQVGILSIGPGAAENEVHAPYA